MNRRQKETAQAQLKSENAVIKELEKQYQAALDDIDTKIRIMESDDMTQSRIYRVEYQKTLKQQVEATLEKLHSDEYSTIKQFLSDSYIDGFVGTMYDLHGQGYPLLIPVDKAAAAKAIVSDTKLSEDLYTALGIDIKKMKKTISNEITRGIASGQTHSEIARNISFASNAPLSRAKTIAKTESHRIQQASTFDAQKAAKAKGADIVKQWDSTLDGDTRPNHRHLDGQIREIDEPFTIGNLKAMFPGDFGRPEEDCNCRCSSLQRARKALDADELKVLKQRAAFFGLDKSDSLNDFKAKYVKGSETVDANFVKAGKTSANGLFVNNSEMLYRFAKKVAPIAGYEDFTCHADADSFYIDLGGEGKEEDYFLITPEEFAERIKESNSYKGGNIRIISCQAGAKDNGAAQKLANSLGVDVYAPTETVHIDENGKMFVSDNDILAEMWYNSTDRDSIKETGKWVLFKPERM